MPGPSTFTDAITSKIATFIGLNGTLPKRKTAGFDIEEFKSAIGTRGVLPTNLFLVTITPFSSEIKAAMNRETLDHRSLSFFCMKTSLPGIDLALEANMPLGTGPVENFPHRAIFTDIELQFIGDAKGQILSFFHNWLNTIVNFDDRREHSKFYRVAYKDSYVCNINITVFNHQSDKILEYRLLDAFPYRINQIDMDWNNTNSMMNIGVNFQYKTWASDRIPISDAASSFGLSNIQKLMKLGTIAQTISAIKRPQSVGDAINLVNNASIVGGGLSGFF